MKPRYQFGLRTLLVVVTLVCLLSGGLYNWQMKIVRDRKACLAMPGVFFIAPDDAHGNPIGWLRTRLGDKPMRYVIVPPGTTPEELKRVTDLFPEATVRDSLAPNEPP